MNGPIACNDCHWQMGWLHRPNEYWCCVKGSEVGDGKVAPDWCPTTRAVTERDWNNRITAALAPDAKEGAEE